MPRKSSKSTARKTTRKVAKPAEKFVSIRNRTKQKQVLPVGEETFSFNPYETIETKLVEAKAKEKFSYWISKHILQIVN